VTEKYYVTTPIYYVNDIPHIGHAYTTIAADILARFHRLLGHDVFFLTGTDEHGQKVEEAARKKNRTPNEHADLLVDNFRRLWSKLDITHSAFIRTTDEEHVRTVQGLLQMLWDRGEIEKRGWTGWYCTPDERFWNERDLSQGKCPDCGRPVEQVEEENYFFLMSKYQKRLIEHIETNPEFILPESRRNEVLGFLRTQELGDLCISRPKSRLSWGVTIPFDENFVTYVWFDALLNYFSATRYLSPNRDRTLSGNTAPYYAPDGPFWWPADNHLIGKDILTTHAVYWSTMLMAMGLPLPRNIFAHGWWTVEGQKMSKSLGNVVDPNEMVDRFGIDAFRFFLFREVPFGLDGDFSIHALIGRVNNDLANDFGNLASRVLNMLSRYRDGQVPSSGAEGPREEEIRRVATGLADRMEEVLKVLRFQKAIEDAWELVALCNKYIEDTAPWKLAKDEADRDQLDTVLYTSAEALRFLCMHLNAFLPVSTERLWTQIGQPGRLGEIDLRKEAIWGRLRPGTMTEKGEVLFPRIDASVERKPMEKQDSPTKTPEDSTGANLIEISDFVRVELKTGKVLFAERVPKSKKLLRIEVDTGEKRQVVAGIAEHYEPEALVGKTIVVVANLKPAKLMGIESQGMILAASDPEGNLAVLTTERPMGPGARIR